jgi:hypothetical protein
MGKYDCGRFLPYPAPDFFGTLGLSLKGEGFCIRVGEPLELLLEYDGEIPRSPD